MSDLQRAGADHLADPCLDVAELPEDDLAGHYPVGHPLAFGLERFKHDVEPLPQVRENVIMVVGIPVLRLQGSRQLPCEHCVGNHLLQTRCGLKHCQQFRARLGERTARGRRIESALWQASVSRVQHSRFRSPHGILPGPAGSMLRWRSGLVSRSARPAQNREEMPGARG